MKYVKDAAKAVGVYLLTNKKARALEWSLAIGAFEAARTALGYGA